MNLEHLIALQTRLAHEVERFAKDRSEIRKVWIAGIEKEIAAEKKFLGLDSVECDMSDDELLAELLK